jgi:cellulose synthase/poly-beta-1,6-N-acetylglucosamine synthase-like glycosyltransferase
MPGLVAAVELSMLYAAYLCISLTRLIGIFVKPPAHRSNPHTTHPVPTMTIMVAMYREAGVCTGLVGALEQLNYPATRLQILFLLEADDEETIASATIATRHTDMELLILPDAPGPKTKPRALNYGLQAATGDLIAVYDAEDAPHRDQLLTAARAFLADKKLGVVQAPLGWYNRSTNWITGQFSLEYAAQFSIFLPLYARLNLPLPLGGTSNVFRRSALNHVGGWDPFNVTEDADLGFRLARHGWRSDVIAPGTLEEAPEDRSAWIAQRSRWLKGHFVTWLVHMRDP